MTKTGASDAVRSIGLRAKTARAVAVIVGGTVGAPFAVLRMDLTFATAATPATFQPFHQVLDLPWERAEEATHPAEASLIATATDQLAKLVEAHRRDGSDVVGVGIVGAPERALASMGSPHIRAHAAEGVLFRRILQVAATRNGLEWRAFPERGIEERAAAELEMPEAAIREHLARFGRVLGRPWRADEKSAALGAWMMLPRDSG